MLITLLSLNGNVAQSVERKSHNLKVVSSILTVPTFFTFFPCSFLSLPSYDSLVPLFLYIVWAYGAMETHQTSDLRIAGSIPAMLVFLLFAPYYSKDIRYLYIYKKDIYKYVVSEEDEGKDILRFWRGNVTTLWNCSITLLYEE